MLLFVGTPVQDTNEMNLPDWDWLGGWEAEMLDIKLSAGVTNAICCETDR